jgi:hypothetical protein
LHGVAAIRDSGRESDQEERATRKKSAEIAVKISVHAVDFGERTHRGIDRNTALRNFTRGCVWIHRALKAIRKSLDELKVRPFHNLARECSVEKWTEAAFTHAWLERPCGE